MQIEFQGIEQLKRVVSERHYESVLLVCDSSFDMLPIKEDIISSLQRYIVFNEFSSNPLRSDVKKGIEKYTSNNCHAILAVGGGSTLDVAKCIKYDTGIDIPIIAVPTTAGTGSEATKHIVVYEKGKKLSLGDERNIPNFVIFEPKVLSTLPLYQKKCTLLDALCQACESWWNINRTEESIAYSKEAIHLICENMENYLLRNDFLAAQCIMKAANLAGKAINITATTAAHAMSYKLTSKYHLPHGHAVAICFPIVWHEMIVSDKCDAQLSQIFYDIATAMGEKSAENAVKAFEDKLIHYDMGYPLSSNYETDITELVSSVNLERLKNSPISFLKNDIKNMYERIVRNEA